jgi:DNA-binding transcriptional regulator PaaX
MNKLKFNFSGPKSEIARDILAALIITSAVAIAITSPYFIVNIIKTLTKLKKYPNKKVYNTFYNLRDQGLVNYYEKNNQIYISLTEKGKQRAGWMQIDNLKIKKPKKWDGKWRLVMFDISNLKRIYREALRGKLKELGFCLFQKSVWINPYDCAKEVKILKEFFSLKDLEFRFVVADSIGADKEFKKMFKLY